MDMGPSLPSRVSYGTSEFMDSRKGGREKSKGSLSASKMKERQKGNVCMANLLPVPPTCIGKKENLLLERERGIEGRRKQSDRE